MNAMNEQTLSSEQIRSCVEEVLASTDLIDVHTHLFAPAFGNLGLWGIDELLTYHYLEAEFFRSSDMPPERYWKLSKTEQADAVWQALFVENTPISEATRGIIAVLKAFDLPTRSPDLAEARSFFRNQNLEAHIARTLRMAGVSTVVMTNDPLYPAERELWMKGVPPTRNLRPCCVSTESCVIGRDIGRFWRKTVMRSTPKYPEKASANSGDFSPTGTSVCSPFTWRFRCRTPSSSPRKHFKAKSSATQYCQHAESSTCRSL